tara:strand:+ start:1656 stop:2132 length:477 start_codon:yes stop_codon:yes gene_type:complete
MNDKTNKKTDKNYTHINPFVVLKKELYSDEKTGTWCDNPVELTKKQFRELFQNNEVIFDLVGYEGDNHFRTIVITDSVLKKDQRVRAIDNSLWFARKMMFVEKWGYEKFTVSGRDLLGGKTNHVIRYEDIRILKVTKSKSGKFTKAESTWNWDNLRDN